MTNDTANRAAAALIAARHDRRPIARLPQELAPASIPAAYEIQAAVVDTLSRGASHAAVAGFKIGATSRAAQEFLALDGPFYGCILADRILDAPAGLPRGDFNFCLIEPEFAVRLGRDLGPRGGGFSRADVAAAVASLHPAFEVVNSAYGDAWREAGAAGLIADNGVHECLVLGPGLEDWRSLDLAGHGVTFRCNGRDEGHGQGANALGHPLDALAWLAAQAPAGGRGLKAGDIVTTGVVTPFLYAEAGDTLAADFGTLGEIQLDITV
jgi:2-keto-4-pentenoate hydratase